MSKPNTPSKVSYRLDEYIDCEIDSILESSGTTKTQVIRALFNLGLNSFFNRGVVKEYTDADMFSFANKSQLNKQRYKLSDPHNCTLTKIQTNDLRKIKLAESMGTGQAIRLVFHIGIEEFKNKSAVGIEPHRIVARNNKKEVNKWDVFNVARDLVHFNCFDKV